MTREEAAAFFQEDGERTVKSMRNFGWSMAEKRKIAAYNAALSALRGPQPDPDTGLVPCGCGGKAMVWPSDLRQAMVTAYQVGCIKCAMTTVWVRGKQENAIKVWNTAMGWKGGAE